ncbi:hypothetical protein CLV25_11036 [Acetobacteroides hydrogenigenes]|uniref:Uncharacterized protein n=1 Tax=Acetobacteroides hydrogenigenes TaxID=979970 RepID=A0A4R2ECL6_9BACT|nr:hypothetical protein CLV25_11036 [Acetobacteroides hydrogenigenes]
MNALLRVSTPHAFTLCSRLLFFALGYKFWLQERYKDAPLNRGPYLLKGILNTYNQPRRVCFDVSAVDVA